MELRNIEGIEEDDPIKPVVERAAQQIENLKEAMEYNFISLQLLVDDESGEVTAAAVAHNPCNLSQFQILAFLPTLDNSLEMMSMNELVSNEVKKLAADMPDKFHKIIFDLCMRRFARGASENPELLIRFAQASSFEEACDVYQSFYGLTEGGDFNLPLRG